ncbi:tripartite tricarboxylate transporter TctB family protein [Campylobacter fetus]|uniref:tripartite tricarboxylate transporter TctB family protein n=1 Tax=Campylobacter fetus TaxID=196 RepID=UPI0008189130|nr:tripartite tricarboxylate transporter TctB family protein [Campylobacter fetus]MPB71663.1 tripartite tricarboxylate transporter TctB family protein [Campylobacter fetus]MPB77419.1 tripartite tricarboxylate transporter TctB family protein [Campylobacter fetus]OCR86640.1 tricarboxylic transport membrane protein [Campylobacter fetus subsp. testudinum]OCR93410.1 tricarboxylic transport membrane protein [Campylobacter fetus subsp. testudinum]OCR94683.1 tricarboxylic transport membrane protein [C
MTERLFGVFLFCTGIFVIYGAMSFNVAFSYDPLGPKTFPILLGILLSVLSVFIIIGPSKAEFANLSINLKIIYLVALIILYQLSFDFLGFLFATFILVSLVSKIFKATNIEAVICGILVSITVYLVFKEVLDIPLPTGVIFENILGE